MYAYHLYHNHLLASIYLSIYLFYFYLFYGLCLVAKFITIVVEFFFCLLFFPTYWCTYGIYITNQHMYRYPLLGEHLFMLHDQISRSSYWYQCLLVVACGCHLLLVLFSDRGDNSTRDRHDGETCGRQGQASDCDTNQSHCHDQRRTCRSSWEPMKQR